MHKMIVTHVSGNPGLKEDDPCKIYHHANAFIWPNHYSKSLEAYFDLFVEARKDFRELGMDSVECLTVIESRWCKGVPILRFKVSPNTQKEGWKNRTKDLPDMVLS